MIADFDADGFSFKYPSNWKLERDDNEEGWSVTVQSPDTAFFMLSVREDLPPVEDLADTALAALRDEYPDLESEPCQDALAGVPATGHDIRFFKFDLTNFCRVRAFHSGFGTVLVLCQATDLEERNNQVLQAICKSLAIDDGMME